MKTYKFEDGKYEADRDDKTGLLVALRRNGDPWGEGLESLRFSKLFHATLNRIDELEAAQGEARGNEAQRWKDYVERLQAQLRMSEEQHLALVREVADGRAFLPPPAIQVNSLF